MKKFIFTIIHLLIIHINVHGMLSDFTQYPQYNLFAEFEKLNKLNKPEKKSEYEQCQNHLQHLIQQERVINQLDEEGNTPLHYAAIYEVSFSILLELLKRKDLNVNAQTVYGQTALHIATRNNNINMVQALLRRGANVCLKNIESHNSLDIAQININLKKSSKTEQIQQMLFDSLGYFSRERLTYTLNQSWPSSDNSYKIVDHK